MANGLDLGQVKAYQDYVQTYSQELLTIALGGFRTAAHLTADDTVQGKKTFSVMRSKGKVLKPFSTTYQGSSHIEMIPRTIETHTLKAELDVVPSDLRGSYLAVTLPNQEVLPAFIQQIVSYFLMQLMTDIDTVLWNGDSSIADKTQLLSSFDGYTKQIKNALTSELTAVVTGAITSSNVITSLESVHDALSETNKEMKGVIYTSKKVKDLYIRANRDAYTKYTNDQKIVTTLLGTDTEIVAVPAWANSSKVMATLKANLLYGYDKQLTYPLFVKPDHYHIEHSTTPELGALIATPWDGEIAVNDQF